MPLAVQGSLFDHPPGGPAALVAPAVPQPRRVELAHGAWVDVQPHWLPGADTLFHRLLDAVPWVGERRRMYDRTVDVPRLLAFCGEGEALPDPLLAHSLELINACYAPALGEPLVTAGFCLYRDGRDSVAWHGDDTGRSRTEDTVIAIVSLGSPRELALRPKGGRTAHRFALGHGDLVVMGGSCQRTWEHAVLKTTRAVGPRISVQFRTRGVR
ncbi:MAG: alpha-ketoglutarate-dependent dioxygenase AlkB [Kineosporiaceae bacterium]|nr:alpha-ketoglutarate-dependent dioxygenase AlkB [Kineosporiaceae bacterium]